MAAANSERRRDGKDDQPGEHRGCDLRRRGMTQAKMKDGCFGLRLKHSLLLACDDRSDCLVLCLRDAAIRS
jgi:hypothetical protein